MTLRGKYNGAKHTTEAWDCQKTVVGERSVSLRRRFERTAGDIRSANADMSNVKAGEKPAFSVSIPD